MNKVKSEGVIERRICRRWGRRLRVGVEVSNPPIRGCVDSGGGTRAQCVVERRDARSDRTRRSDTASITRVLSTRDLRTWTSNQLELNFRAVVCRRFDLPPPPFDKSDINQRLKKIKNQIRLSPEYFSRRVVARVLLFRGPEAATVIS